MRTLDKSSESVVDGDTVPMVRLVHGATVNQFQSLTDVMSQQQVSCSSFVLLWM